MFPQTKDPYLSQKTINPARWLGYFTLFLVSVFTPRPVKADLTHTNPRLVFDPARSAAKAIAPDKEPQGLRASSLVDRGELGVTQNQGDRLKQQTLSTIQTIKPASKGAVSVAEFGAPLTQAQELLEQPKPPIHSTLSMVQVNFADRAQPPEFLLSPQVSDPDLGIIQIEEAPLPILSSPEIPQMSDPDLGSPQVSDPDLGIIQIEEAPLPVLSPPEIPQMSDPDLGVMQIEEQPQFEPAIPRDPTNPQLPIYPPFIIQPSPTDQCPDPDPDLGCFKIEFPPPPRPKQVFLSAGVSYTQRTNVLAGIDPINDGLFQTGLVLYGAPRIGSETFLEFTAAANIIRYSQEVNFDYNDLFFSLGILQRLSPTMYLGLGWSNQQLFQANDNLASFARPKGQRFLNDHSARVELRRQDRLANRLFWNTYYRFQWTFSDPDDRTRAINLLAAGLTYDVQPNLQVGLDYTLAVTNYTNIDRDDWYNQVTARLSYTMFRNTRLAFFAGYSFGSSTDPTIDFDGFVFGVGLNVQIGLF